MKRTYYDIGSFMNVLWNITHKTSQLPPAAHPANMSDG